MTRIEHRFPREEKDYLRRKGLNFDNSKCCLVIGTNIPDEGRRRVGAKERLNPAIEVVTYDGLVMYIDWVTEFARTSKIRD